MLKLCGVRSLGRIPYAAGLALQQTLAEQYKDDHGKAGEILLCEHNPVYTFGLREKDYALRAGDLQSLGAEVFKIRRGGLTTFHGPGQLVCYPVLNLRTLKVGVKQYVHSLEDAVIAACRELGVSAHTTGYTGVWVGSKKISAIGIQVTHGVAYHGLALNCNMDLSWFEHITPCGIEDRGVTSLGEQLGREVLPAEAAPLLLSSLASTLGLSLENSEETNTELDKGRQYGMMM